MAIQPGLRHSTGITTHALGGLALFGGVKRHINELRTQRLDLFFDAGTHIRGLNHRAHALGRGNRLQARHADAQNHDACRFDSTRCGHQHGEEALVFIGRQHDGLVPGDVGLRRKHIHALGTGGTRGSLQRKCAQARQSHLLQTVFIEGIEHADQGRAGLHHCQFMRLRCSDLQHHLTAQRVSSATQFGTNGLVGSIGHAGCQAGTRLNTHAMSRCDQLLHGLGRGGNAGFPRYGFGGYANLHE